MAAPPDTATRHPEPEDVPGTDGPGVADAPHEAHDAHDAQVLAAVFDAAAVMLVVLDSQAKVIRMNAACARLVGADGQPAEGRPVWQVLPADDAEVVTDSFTALHAGKAPPPFEQLLVTKVGNRHRIAWTYTIVRTPGGAIRYVVGTGIDVTEHRMAEAAWEQRVHTDPLTGIGNRVAFEGALSAHLDPTHGLGCGLLFCDLDAFKAVNDTHGHAAGDELLVQVAHRLSVAVRDGDLVARVGGDEFVVLLPAAGAIETRAAAARVERAINRAFRLACGVVRVGISVGPRVADAGEDPAAVLREADEAMYAVKARRGRRRESA